MRCTDLAAMANRAPTSSAHKRNWIHVRDHCRGIVLALEEGAREQVCHLGAGSGAGDSAENLELVRSLCDAVDATFQGDPSVVRAVSTLRRCPWRAIAITHRVCR